MASGAAGNELHTRHRLDSGYERFGGRHDDAPDFVIVQKPPANAVAKRPAPAPPGAFGGLEGVEPRVELLVRVTADQADREPGLFDEVMSSFDALLTAVLGHMRNREPDRLPVNGRVHPEVGFADRFLDGCAH